MLGRARRQESQEGLNDRRRKTLRELREFGLARRLESPGDRLGFEIVGARYLRPGQNVLVLADDMLPADGEVIDGAGRVDESAVVGPGQPALRVPGGSSSHVVAGSRLVSGWLVLNITAGPADCLLQSLVERGS